MTIKHTAARGFASSAAHTLALSCALAVALVAAVWSPSAQAAPVQPGFTESIVFDDLVEPSDIAFAPDGRVFVAEKSGLIKVFANLNATTPTIAVDMRTQVYNFWDRGLLGIALDPQFPVRPYMYAMYARDAEIGGTAPRWGQPGVTNDPCPSPPGPTEDGCIVSSRLAKLTLSGNTVTNQETLIEDWCQQYPSHSAGAVVFGPDGMLYASGGEGASFTFTDYGQEGQPVNPCGDPPVPVGSTQSPPSAEGGALRAQDVRTSGDPTGLGGSIIRVNPDTGAGAPGNPLAGSSDPNTRRLVAHGFRNPFRFVFRPGTSEIYAGDVGWGSWEEIDHVPSAADAKLDNFGWPCYEGNGRQGAYDGAGLDICEDLYDTAGAASSPFFAYSHSGSVTSGENCAGGGSSTSGLAFYQGGNYPAAYHGALFFADYSRRCTWVMFEKNGQPDPSTRLHFLRQHDPVNLKIGPGGDLFVVDFAGSVRRVSFPGGENRAPTALALADPSAGPLPLTVQFDGSGSSDPDAGDALTYAWDLDGDGQFDDSSAVKPSWTYTSLATVSVRLRVTDKGGLSATDVIVIGAGNEPPEAHIDTPTAAPKWAVGDEISFTGHGTDPDDGALGAESMKWNLVMNHCVTVNDCHTHPLEGFPNVAGAKFVAPDHEYPSHLELRLTVTDSFGLTDTATLRLDPRTVELSFATDPPGLALTVGQQTVATPVTRTVIVGSRNSVAAPTPQAVGGVWHGFSSWSDGGARSHDVIAPAAPTTYTATFKPEAAPTGLVLAFGFDETSGSVANDASPANNDGALNGPSSSASGRFGRALSFDGVNDRVDVPDANSLDLSGAMTLEAWLRPTTVSGWRTALIKERGSTDHVYALYASNGTAPNGENFTGGLNQANGPNPLPLNTWSHLTTTYDGSALRLYVNGALVSTKAASGTMPNTASAFRVGASAVWGEYFSGLIDEVRVYSRALSEAEIKADMNSPIGAPAPPDNTPPTVSISAPAAGTVTGAVTLRASASDNVGVAGVQFLVDGAPFNAEDTSAPYEVQWPSTSVPNGTHRISARATDAASNATTSAEVNVTVDNPPAPSALVLALGFDETSGSVANDASPANNDGTLNGATSNASGRFGRALSFDGVNDRVDVPDSSSLDLSGAMTLEAWLRPTTVSGWRTALIKERGANDHVYAMFASNGTAPNGENFTGGLNQANGAGALPLNTWSHLTTTYDGSALRLYVNGSLVSTKAASGAMPNTASPFRVGASAVWGEYFSGLIDEVRVYSRALSEAEIKADMNAPIGTPPPPDNTPPTVAVTAPPAGTVSGAVTLRANASDNVGVAGVQFLVDGVAFGAEDTSAPYEVQWPSTAVGNGTHKISARARDAASNSTTSAEVTVTVDNPPAPSALVLAFGFNETSGSVANDASPANNDGTLNGPTSNASGRFGRALSFDGVNDRVDVPDSSSLDLSGAMTLEAWLRPTTVSGWRTALIKERGSTDHVYALYASNGTVPNSENFTGGLNQANGAAPLALNTWTHLASTYDGSALRLYVNGALASTKAASGAMPNTASAFRVGASAVWGEYFSGLIDEVRVYSRALSEAEIKADMNAAVSP